MIGNKLKNKTKTSSAGYSIVEMLVAMSIFITVSTLSIGAFLNATEAQRIIIFEETIAENVNFAVEFMSRQMRTAVRSDNSACIPVGDTFGTPDSSTIKFVNTDGDCVEFRIQGTVLQYTSDATPLPGLRNYIDLIISDLVQIDRFDIVIDGESSGDGAHPRATISIEAIGVPQTSADPQNMVLIMQTTVSTRITDS
ncbi:MAG: hypothetical protein WDZ40_02100 [Candidatus Spechtbacterales bacterium]